MPRVACLTVFSHFHKRLGVIWLVLGLSFILCCPGGWADPLPSATEVAAVIQANFESHRYQIPRREQKHYALRLYRITGDSRYINAIIADAVATLPFFQKRLAHLNDPGYVQGRTQYVLDHHSRDSPRSQLRQGLLESVGSIAFDRVIVYEMNKIAELGLLNTPGFEATALGLSYLKTVDWSSYVLRPDMIRGFSAKLISDVYYLYDLGIVDLREVYIQAFRQAFPDTEDSTLDPQEFEAKVYGLTHIILSESRYYQYFVDPAQFAWIFDWFDRNFERLVRESKPDVLAELALSYLITHQSEHPMVERVKQALIWAFNPEDEMIPSSACRVDYRVGEHRNLLTIMVFRWSGQLFPGPDLKNIPEYRRLWPEFS